MLFIFYYYLFLYSLILSYGFHSAYVWLSFGFIYSVSLLIINGLKIY